MTALRRAIGYGILMTARGMLWSGMMLSRVGWWLMDREDMIAAQKAVAVVIAQEFERRGRA